MPLPKPRKNEAKQRFISRCIANPTMKKEYKNKKQRIAVCYSQWKHKKK